MYELDPLLSLPHYLSQLLENKYLMLDGGRFHNVYEHIYEKENDPEFAPLFKGTYFESIMEVSPCLIKLNAFIHGLLPWFLDDENAAGKGWIFTSIQKLPDLVMHFQDLLIAQLPDKRRVLFRYYDPEIINVLATCEDQGAWRQLTAPCSEIIWRHKEIFYKASFDSEEKYQ